MTDPRLTLLIPVLFPGPELYPVEQEYIEGLDGFHIVLFGYWQVPADISPDVVREDHEIEAEAVLYEMAAQFSRAGAETDIQLHFGPSEDYTRELQNRIAAETDSDAVVSGDQLTWWQNVLVPLRDSRNQDRVVDFVTAFDADDLFVLELYHVTRDESTVESAEAMLDGVRETLLDRGFSEADIEVTVDVNEDATGAITDRARGHNLVVLGETEQLDEELFYGPLFEHLRAETETPVAVVRS